MNLAIDLPFVVGMLAAAMLLSCYVMRSHRKFILMGTLASYVWAVHYSLLEQTTPCMVSILSGTRIASSLWVMHQGKKTKAVLTVLVWTLLVGIAVLTWHGPASAFSVGGSLISATAVYWLQGLALRKTLVASDSLWIIAGWFAGSVPGMLMFSLALILNLSTIARMRKQSAP